MRIDRPLTWVVLASVGLVANRLLSFPWEWIGTALTVGSFLGSARDVWRHERGRRWRPQLIPDESEQP